MPSHLSPAEAVGLAGASLEARVRRATTHVSDATFARIGKRLMADAKSHDMIYDHDGTPETVRIMLRPLLVMPEQLAYVHHVCLDLVEALERLPALYLEDPRFRRVLAVTDDEATWLREMWTESHRRLNPIYGRLDATCDFAAQGWQSSLKFMEPNLSGVGGINYAPVAEELVMRDVVPTLVAHDPTLRIERPVDQRDLFIQVLIDHARAIGRPRANLVFIEPKYEEDGPDEQSALSRHFAERYGLTIVHADPRELTLKGAEVFYNDVPIDVAYRDYETRELISLERELGKPLEAMRLLFKENRVVSSLAGDFDHKSCWEILTDDSLSERYFSADERRLFRRHVLWTRVVGARKTLLPHNVEGDLLEFARTHREELVLKPNRSYGGSGVAIGASIGQGEWEGLLNDAAENYEDPLSSWVLQQATALPVSEFPAIGANGRVVSEPFYVVMGFAPTDNGLGIMCRVSQKQVVNVAQHGGMAAVLLAHPPEELHIPRRSRARGADTAEAALRAEISELLNLDRAISALEWDEEVMLPELGREDRGGQLATLEAVRHKLLVADRLSDLIEEVGPSGTGDWPREIALLKRLRHEAMALPEDLVRELAAARAAATGAWEAAREKNDFAVFAPSLEKLVGLVRARAESLSTGGTRYDALLDLYEPGMTLKRLMPVLQELRGKLVPMVERLAQPEEPGADPLNAISDSARWALAERVLEKIGFDFRRGRLDTSTHPFTTQLGGGDVRLTMRKKERLAIALLTILHEGGHALYDLGFAPADRMSLLGDAPSMGMHEGQSRLWENHVGRSAAFWKFVLPLIGDAAGTTQLRVGADELYRSVNRVTRGTVRTSADEISYHLHIILRVELESALMDGTLSVRDLKSAWNEKSRAILGAEPNSDLVGVLQDGHWAGGMFGYFPTYTIGSLYAAQLAETYTKTHALPDEIAKGEFGALLGWLRKHVHAAGHRFDAEELMVQITGYGLDAGAYFRHLESKF